MKFSDVPADTKTGGDVSVIPEGQLRGRIQDDITDTRVEREKLSRTGLEQSRLCQPLR